MEETKIFDTDFCKKTVIGFRTLNPMGLSALGAELSLSPKAETLLTLQKFYQGAALRDPTVGELRFLTAMGAHLSALPHVCRISGVNTENGDALDVLRDMERMEKALKRTPNPMPTAENLLNIGGAYLAYAGKKAVSPLSMEPPALLLARSRGVKRGVAMDFSAVSAAVGVEEGAPQWNAGMLMLLMPDEERDINHAAAQFFGREDTAAAFPIAAIGSEGLFPHLIRHGKGVRLDLSTLPDYREEGGVDSITATAAGSLLFAAPEASVPYFLSLPFSTRLIGRVENGRVLRICYGMDTVVSLPLSYLSLLAHPKTATVTVEAETEETAEVLLEEGKGNLLSGVELKGENSMKSLLQALARLLLAGGVPSAVESMAVLTLPLLSDAPHEMSRVFAALLSYHRFGAELAIPAAHCKVVTAPRGTSPSLSVTLFAPVGHPLSDEAAADVQNAALSGDFQSLRYIFLGK